MENKKLQRNKKWKTALVSAAAALGIFVGANGICYAATGENLVSKVVIFINGEEVERDIEWHEEGDTLVGTVEYEVSEDEEDASIAVQEVPISDNGGTVSEGVYPADDAANGMILLENERTYLVLEDGAQKVDITEDIADGIAEGTVLCNGEEYVYVVVWDEDGYSVSVGVDDGE